MKLNRLMGILVVLMLMLNSFGALAENPAEAGSVPPLYVVLVDCGWTLCGDAESAPGANSVVSAVGDPEGLVLSFVEGALPKLAEPGAMMMVLGYDNQLRGAENIAPAAVSDAAAIAAQVNALRALSGNHSSLLNNALNELGGVIGAHGAGYDCRLMVISGGAVNYSTEDALNNALGGGEVPVNSVRNALTALRDGGVKISSFVWDLNGSARLNAGNLNQGSLVLTAENMAENCAMISGNEAIDLVIGMCDSIVNAGGAFNAPAVQPLKSADLSGLKSNDVAVILTAGKTFEVFSGESILTDLPARKAAAAEGDIVRLYSAAEVSEQDALRIRENRLTALVDQMDADKNGELDTALEVGGAPLSLPVANIADYVFAAEPADAFSAAADGAANTLTLTAARFGAAKLIVTTADGALRRELSVKVANYGITWNLADAAPIYVGEEASIAVCADPANVLEGTVTLNGSVDSAAALTGELKYAPAEPGTLVVSLSVSGRAPESRAYPVQYRLAAGEESRNLAMKYPYFAAQQDQSVQIMDANGQPIPLDGFTVSESALADVYFDADAKTLFLAPKAAGAEVITLTDEVSGQTVTLTLTVESLFSGAMFWVLAAGVPVCLIGLTAMIVLLIVKLGGKRR